MAARQTSEGFLDSPKQETFSVTPDFEGRRLDIYLASQPGLANFSRTRLQKIIDGKGVLINGRPAKAKQIISAGDAITIDIPQVNRPSFVEPIALPLNIVFEDEHLMVVNKPAGLVVHPGSGSHKETLLQGLLYYAKDKNFTPSLVHRLDKDTSGLLLCAKTEGMHEQLAKQFKQKANLREYVAILNGVLSANTISRFSYLKRHPQIRTKFCSMELTDFEKFYPEGAKKPKNLRYSASHFKTMKTYRQRLSMVTVRLETGRTHQIRIHAADLQAPILGDSLYGVVNALPQVFSKETRQFLGSIGRQMLHAQFLGITHPVSGKKIAFTAEVPDDIRGVLQNLEKYVD